MRDRLPVVLCLAILLQTSDVCSQDDAAIVRALQSRTQAVIQKCEGAVVALIRGRAATINPVQGGFGVKPEGEPPAFREAVATGIVVSRDDDRAGRYLLTTCHAVRSVVNEFKSESPPSVNLQLSGRRMVNGTVIAADSRCDLAVLKLDLTAAGLRPDEVTSLSIGDLTTVEKGSLVVVLGNSVSIVRDGAASGALGMVSNSTETEWNGNLPAEVDRDLMPADLYPLWHISGGVGGTAEGGAVVDLEGRLLAVTTGRVHLEGQTASATYAMPLSRVTATLLRGEEVELGFFGIDARTRNGGVSIAEVAPGSLADDAGLKAGDLVVRWGDRPLVDAREFNRATWLTRPGTGIVLTVRRTNGNGIRERDIDLTAIHWPVRNSELVFATTPRRNWRGMTVDAATSRRDALSDGPFGRLPTGVLVRDVVEGSPATALRQGQLITAVNGVEVGSPAEFFEAAPREAAVRLKLADGETAIVPAP